MNPPAFRLCRLTRRLWGALGASLLAGFGALGSACSADDAEVVDTCDSKLSPYPHLPDLSNLGPVNCATGDIDGTKARVIYDDFFASRFPKGEGDFGWTEDPSLVSKTIIETVSFPTAFGETVDTYHELFSFDPDRFPERQAAVGKSNFDIFAQFTDQTPPRDRFKNTNVYDYVPAAMTHYARAINPVTDIMGTQFVFQAKCAPQAMEAALASCPDCVDAFTPLSKYDLHRVLELRFARVKDGKVQVSKPMRVVGVDTSGAIISHATASPYQFLKVGNETWRARWRGEISGKMARLLETYGGPTPALVRITPPPGPEQPDGGGGSGGHDGGGGQAGHDGGGGSSGPNPCP